MQYTFDTNAYVEQATNYGADKVLVKLDESTNRVTLELVDEYGTAIVGAPKLVDETFAVAEDSIKYYEEVIHQLSQGDVVRNYTRPGVTVRDGYDNDANRYPSF